MYGPLTYRRYWYNNNDKIDCHVSNCIRKQHPESIHAFLLECPERSPIRVEVLATSFGNGNDESHNPQNDDSYCEPADDNEFATAKYPAIEKADGNFQKPEGYGMYQIEGSLQLV